MAPVLKLIPTKGFTDSREMKVSAMQFGDGYEERAKSGLNNARSNWQITANGMCDEKATELDDQLTQWEGVTAFHWHSAGEETTRLYTCSKWSFAYVGPDCQNFNAEFKEVFVP